jgi:hypothetical protein
MAADGPADENSMKIGNLIASTIVLIWGGAVLLYALTGGSGSHGSGAYQTGQAIGLVFALVLVFAGGRGLRKELRKRHAGALK